MAPRRTAQAVAVPVAFALRQLSASLSMVPRQPQTWAKGSLVFAPQLLFKRKEVIQCPTEVDASLA
jgi:hypothetical protein